MEHHPMKTQLGTIDSNDLETVTGGTTSTPAATDGSSDDPVLASLQGIASSLANLNKPSGGLFGGNSMLLLGMVLAMRRSEVVVYNGNDHGHGHGWGGGGGWG
jgi:hypothetical protein